MESESKFLAVAETWAKLYFFNSLTDFFNHLKHTELSILQAYALTFLSVKGAIKISDLCDHMMVSPAAATQLVDRLEKLDMVTRIADPKDRRVRKVIVLEKGEKFVQEQFEMSQNWLTQLPAELTPEQKEQITTLLSMFVENSHKQE